jgi:FtsP/CotA-like multicopper oxidase with cupredoxin domain
MLKGATTVTTRRTILKAGALGGASLLLPVKAMAAGGMGGMGGRGGGGGGGGGGGMGGGGMGGMTCSFPASPATLPFQMALPFPKTLMPMADPDGTSADYYMITAKTGIASVYPGWQTPIIGYDGSYPGPSIVARSGRPVKLHAMNMLSEPISVHLHGGHVPAESDGHPLDVIMPPMSMDTGEPMVHHKLYTYPNANQIAATLWYHDHAMYYTSQHAYFGMAGFYILTDSVEDNLPLPKAPYDIPLVIQDRRFNADRSFHYSEDSCTIMHGYLGDKILVNGAIQPYLEVANRKYRFRILNGSNARFYQLSLSNGQPFVQIGSDGGLLPAPISRSSMLISPGERIEVVIDFASSPGSQIVLRNTLGSGDTATIMRFDVVRREKEQFSVPRTLRPLTRLSTSKAKRTRRLTMSMLGMSSPDPWGFNGLSYDPMRIDADPALDDVEIWEIVNPMGMNHNFHAHAVMWQLVSRNGVAPAAYEAGWKDTFAMPGMSTIRVIAQFTDYKCSNEVKHSDMDMPGMQDYYMNYMSHCHILEHEDNGMMSGFSIV